MMNRHIYFYRPTKIIMEQGDGYERITLGDVRTTLFGIRIPVRLADWLTKQ